MTPGERTITAAMDPKRILKRSSSLHFRTGIKAYQIPPQHSPLKYIFAVVAGVKVVWEGGRQRSVLFWYAHSTQVPATKNVVCGQVCQKNRFDTMEAEVPRSKVCADEDSQRNLRGGGC